MFSTPEIRIGVPKGPPKAFIRHLERWISQYAAWTGLENRWQMFGRQARFHQCYLIKGRYGRNTVVEIPVPMQTDRTFWQYYFSDFKETKFMINMILFPAYRNAYARYICREYPTFRGQKIRSVIFTRYHQDLYERSEASRLGKYIKPGIHSDVMNEFPCEINAAAKTKIKR